MIKDSLFEEIGLNHSEIKIYKRLLEYGELSPPRLSELTGLTRQNAYAALRTLSNKELIDEDRRKKKLTYRPVHPGKLNELVDRKIDESREVHRSLQSFLPELEGMYFLSGNKPGITYFEGLNGVKRIYEDILKDKPNQVQVFRSVYDKERLDKYLTWYIKRQLAAGIETRIISPKLVTDDLIEKDKKLNRARKYVPESLFRINTQIMIYNNNIAFITLEKKLMGFVISSKDVAQTLRTIFETLWVAKF